MQVTEPSQAAAPTNAESIQKSSAAPKIELLGASVGSERKRQAEPLRYLFEGLAEKAEKAAQQDPNNSGPRDVWKLTLPAPASVNVLWALSAPDVRKAVEEAHRSAAEYALRHAESNMGVLRRGDAGKVQQGSLERVSIEHRTTRNQEPLLRTKAVLKIKGLAPDGTQNSETRIDSFAGGVATRVIYQVQLAAELRQRLGLTIEPEQKGFHIAWMSQNLCNGFPARCLDIGERVHRQYAQTPQAPTEAHKAETSQGETAQPNRFRRLKPDHLSQVVRGPSRDERLSALWNVTAESFDWNAAGAQRLVRWPRKPQCCVRAFRNAMGDAEQRIFPEKQTARLLSWTATRLAVQHGAGADELLRTLRKIRPASGRSFVHIEWRPLFRKARWWSPVKNLKAPVIAFGERPRRWNSILWRKRLLFIELRIQNRRIFPRAPNWTGLRKLELPALRIRHRWPQLLKRPETKKYQMQHGH